MAYMLGTTSNGDGLQFSCFIAQIINSLKELVTAGRGIDTKHSVAVSCAVCAAVTFYVC